MNKPLDRFSKVASGYAKFRPRYPASLYSFILDKVRVFDVAWDAGTGNGQVASVLAHTFDQVYATDISVDQLAEATPAENIRYIRSPSEKTPLPSDCADLITVGQAVHWFDLPVFGEEVRRVARKGAVLAIWGYGLFRCHPAVDALVKHFHYEIVGPYWDPHRDHIDEMYAGMHFPFTPIESPAFEMQEVRTLETIAGYLGTWSAVLKYRTSNHEDPLPALMSSIQDIVGPEAELRCVTPIFMRMWRI